MLKNKLIISPLLLPWNWSADYQKQTLARLAKNNTIILYDQKDAHFFLKKPTRSQHPPLPKNISLYTPKYYLPFRRVPLIEELNKRLSFLVLLFQLRKQEKLIWIFDPFFYFMTTKFNAISLYDCVDYHAGKKNNAREIKNQENVLIRSVDLFFVNSNILKKKHIHTRKRAWLVPQGFDLQTFQNAEKQIKKKPRSLLHRQTTIGYVGGINFRLNFNLIQNLVQNNPDWRFVFWGPIQDEAAGNKIKKLKQFKNFTHGSSNNKSAIPQVITDFDICIIPYDVSLKMNKYSYPMKVFEYFYLGKPIISTEIEELKKFPQFIKISNSPQKWQILIRSMLQKPWPKYKQITQKQLAIDNSWDRKITVITDVIMNRGKNLV